MDRSQGSASRKVMTEPRRRYKRCLATRLKESDYTHCLDNYDDEAYDKIDLIPPSLTQRVYNQGDATTKQVLEHKLTRKTGTFSDLPTGLRSYISRNPDQFREYYQIRANEVGLLKAVLKNLSNDDKRKLREYYQENGKLEPEKFSDIIASHSSSPSSKRPRS